MIDIIELNGEIAGIVERQAALRMQIDAIVTEQEGSEGRRLGLGFP